MLPELYYKYMNEPNVLPDWAYFFLQIGSQMASEQIQDERCVIAIAVPSRHFAAALIAFGYVYERVRGSNCVDQTRIDMLLNQDIGTPVYVRSNDGKKYKGTIEGFSTMMGKSYIDIRTTGNQVRSVPLESHASRITIAERDISLPKYKQTGQQAEIPTPFLNSLIKESQIIDYIVGSSYESAIIGNRSQLQQEICDEPFYVKSQNNRFLQGNLQEILRMRSFSGLNKSYKSECISSNSIDNKQTDISDHNISLVVFDGAVGFIKSNHLWLQCHQIVVLDRCERQFPDAVQLINDNYAYRTESDVNLKLKIPPHIEMMAYRELV